MHSSFVNTRSNYGQAVYQHEEKTEEVNEERHDPTSKKSKYSRTATQVTPEELKMLGKEIMDRKGLTMKVISIDAGQVSFFIDPVILAEIWHCIELHEHEEDWMQKGADQVHLL